MTRSLRFGLVGTGHWARLTPAPAPAARKPAAIFVADAGALVDAVAQASVASVVFFTARFQADARAWLAAVTATGRWAGVRGVAGSALRAGNP